MMGDLLIICLSCRFERSLTMRCKFLYNFTFDVNNRNLNCFNLINYVIWKNIDKVINVLKYSGVNKITNFSIFHNVTTHIWINFIYQIRSSIQLLWQKLMLLASPRIHSKTFSKKILRSKYAFKQQSPYLFSYFEEN